ncbi:MAG: hypothetical protein IBX45_13405 [Campylobacterales bacterium]|nr:hypothetical protein [Campylobacterales bacterium]
MEYWFSSYNPSQQKVYSESTQMYNLYLDKLKVYRETYRYRYGLQSANGKEYIFKEDTFSGKRKYSAKTQESELYIKTYNTKKAELKQSIKDLKSELDTRAKYNRFEKIGRAPNHLVEILTKINELGLNDKLVVIGTNALYAYEMEYGIIIEQQHLATTDIDILNKRNVKLPLAVFTQGSPLSVVDMLKSIDSSFQENPKAPYQYVNKNHLIVELINPLTGEIMLNESRADPFFDIVQKLDMNKIEWLNNSRLSKNAVIVAENGKMAKMTTIHAIDFMVYKLWLSKQPDRAPFKAERDATQAKIVTQILKENSHYNLDEELEKLQHIKKEVVETYKAEILSKYDEKQKTMLVVEEPSFENHKSSRKRQRR